MAALAAMVLPSSARVVTMTLAADAGYDWEVSYWAASCVADDCSYGERTVP
jgi:hypothetical protein